MTNNLSTLKCEACHADAPKISDNELHQLMIEIPEWTPVVRDGVMMLERVYLFKNYKLAWAFSNKVAELAEKEFHHPATLLEWGKVTVTWWTHAISGLHKNDLICAAKTDQLL